jgi:thioredoxin-related protein
MFDRAGCPWCRKWDREIATVYPITGEGQRAPLRRVSLDRPSEEARKLSPPVFYSPTFVLMEDGREVGRITGYANEEAFWGLLQTLLDKTGRKPESR